MLLVAAALAAALSAQSGSPAAAESPRLQLRYASFDPLVATPELPGELGANADGGLWIVQFDRIPTQQDRDALAAVGGHLVSYLPSNAYVVRMDAAAAQATAALPHADAFVLVDEVNRHGHLNRSVGADSQEVDMLDLFRGRVALKIPNHRLLALAGRNAAVKDAFKLADEVLLNAVRGISDLITVHGLINLDFADVRTIMNEMGMALMGTGIGRGENRAEDAAQTAIEQRVAELTGVPEHDHELPMSLGRSWPRGAPLRPCAGQPDRRQAPALADWPSKRAQRGAPWSEPAKSSRATVPAARVGACWAAWPTSRSTRCCRLCLQQ